MSKMITARIRSRCVCSTWVQPGEIIKWDPTTRRTVGCRACHYSGEHPDPTVDPRGLLSDEDYLIFHD